MNKQMQTLANLIASVQRKLPTAVGATKLLRTICRDAADAAPEGDLVCIAQLLYDIRAEAAGVFQINEAKR